MEKNLFITHVDLDGISALILAWFYNIKFDKFICLDYKDQDLDDNCEILKDYDGIYYVDFSPSEKNLFYIKEDTKIIIIDHHVSAYEHLSKYIKENSQRYINYIYDNEKCGTTLFLKWIEDKIIKKPVSSIIQDYCNLVEGFDLWKESVGKEKFEEYLNLNRLLWKLAKYKEEGINKHEWFINNQLQKFKLKNTTKFFYYDSEKLKIEDYKNKEYEKLINAKNSMMVRTDDRGNKFGIITLKSGSSIIAHYILSERTDLTYLIIINNYFEEQYKLSLRSKNFNLLQLKDVAGHEHSAGIDNWTHKDISNLGRNIIKNIPYKQRVR